MSLSENALCVDCVVAPVYKLATAASVDCDFALTCRGELLL